MGKTAFIIQAVGFFEKWLFAYIGDVVGKIWCQEEYLFESLLTKVKYEHYYIQWYTNTE